MAYYTLITDKGKAALVKSSSTGDTLTLTHIAAGDGIERRWRPLGDSNPCCRRERAVS